MRGKKPNPKIEPAVLTAKELAEYLQLDRATIYHLLKTRQLPGFQVGSDWRFNVKDIDRWRMHAEEMPAYGKRRRSG